MKNGICNLQSGAGRMRVPVQEITNMAKRCAVCSYAIRAVVVITLH